MNKRIIFMLLILALVSACSLIYFSQWSNATVNEPTVARNDFVGNNSTTAFNFDFKIFTKTDIEVFLDGTLKVVDTDYSVSGLGSSQGGTVTFFVAPPTSSKVAILRKQKIEQQSLYQINEGFPSQRVMKDLDKQTMVDQMQNEQIRRSIRFGKKSLLYDIDFPEDTSAAARANKYLKWNSAGTGLELITLNPTNYTFPVSSSDIVDGTIQAADISDVTITDVKMAASGITTRSKLPSQLAYEDEANTFTQAQRINAGLGINAAPPGTAGDVSISGTYQSTKACATGFTRVVGGPPNFCKSDKTISTSTWTDATACTGRTTGASLSADAKFVFLALRWQILSNNAPGNRANAVIFFNDSSCTSTKQAASSYMQMWEQAAVSAGTQLTDRTDHLIVPLPATDTFYATQNNAGGNGNGDINVYWIEGYWD